MYATRSKIPADGLSDATITVELPAETIRLKSKVRFKTTSGLFENKYDTMSSRAQLLYDSGRNKMIAEVKLRSSVKPDTAKITVSLDRYTTSIKLIILRAEPETIKISLSSLSLNTGFDKSVTITSVLKRSTGTPSQNSICDLVVKDKDGNLIGQFLNYSNQTNELGVIVNQFTLGKNTYSGELTVYATSLLSSGDTITATSTFNAN
jgi:hypothetical protein